MVVEGPLDVRKNPGSGPRKNRSLTLNINECNPSKLCYNEAPEIRHLQIMIRRLRPPVLLALLGCALAIPVAIAGTSPTIARNSAADAAASFGVGSVLTNFHLLSPGPLDGQIATVTARMLERFHYSRQPFDAALSSKFLDRYLESLDPQHLHFLQSDLAEFETYRTNLDRLTLRPSGGDTRPGCVIFDRFLLRLGQRVAYADALLKSEKFRFDTDEKILVNRRDEPYPKDLTEAHKLWRDRLRFEYLQEKLIKMDARKKASKTPAAEVKNGDKKPKKTEAEEIVDTLIHRYHRNLRTFVDWDSDDVLQIYLTALARVYDPHSDYFGKPALDSFAIGMNLSLYGIGAELVSEDGYCTINRLLPGGPAAKSKKIKEKDRIIAVAQSNQPPVDVVDMSLNKAVQMIRGPKGTEVRLTIIPAGGDSSAQTVLSLIRDEIKLEDQEAKAKLIELPDAGGTLRLGVIDLPSFYAPFDVTGGRDKGGPKSSTSEDVAKLLTKLKKENVQGVILDLRRNGGGSLDEAIRLTGLFIKEGPVVQVVNTDGKVEEESDTDPSVLYDGPLIVLTSRFSASASEILAGALQDYGRALIVGDSSTHGKGTVQSVNPLRNFIRMPSGVTNDPGALKLTIKKFYRASGASTQLRGVTPDIILPSVLNESKDIGEQALENPLSWDTIPPAKYDRLNLVEPYLPELRKCSKERLAVDKDYAYVREDIEQFKKAQADKTISLNEKTRLKEKAELDARNKAREKERLARAEPPEKIYDLTLKLAALPGLPPPTVRTNSSLAKVSGKGAGLPGADTNGNVAAVAPSHLDDTEAGPDDALDEKAPAVDPPLHEAERILTDYVGLFRKGGLLTVTH